VGHRPVGLAWFSPDCKHFSKAKGGKPRSRGVRDLAWVIVLWMRRARPRVVMLENVEEFRTWGPLDADGRPCETRQGQTFQQWVREIRRLGYRIEWRELRACDYGAPTIRKRLFVIARRDGRPIVWPEPTHGAPDSEAVQAGRLKPWRTAAEIIDWSLPCPSIFDTAEEIMTKHGLRAVRPLADNTRRRIARGVMRYVVESPRPFVMMMRNSGKPWSPVDEPIQTITAGGAFPSLVVPELARAPWITYGQQGGANRSAEGPLHTITASAKDQNAVAAATLIQTGYGERPGQAPRALDIGAPIGTQVAGGTKHAVVAAFLAQHNTGMVGRPAGAPVSTLTSVPTQQQVVAASLMVNTTGHAGGAADAPVSTITTGSHAALIGAFLSKYYGTGDGAEIGDPMHTVTTRDRFGLVTVEIDGATYAIADIGMRMLNPRERFRAQGFPDGYQIETGRGPDGDPVKLTATAQGRMCGNSVCPPLAAALARANVPELAEGRAAA
ncbi:MAG: DNA cytosine methyltransferase, partial [Pseudomonadota bacterium]|nr:DNA cytosine methyltransferase [Pseudomonadota bacterium]